MIDTIAKLAIGIITLAMFAAYVAFVSWKGASDATQQMILTAMIGWCSWVLGYFIGSSAGSSAKDKTIATLNQKDTP